MPLDPQAQALLDQIAALNEPPLSTQTPEMVRQAMQAELEKAGAPEEVTRVENRTIPGPAGEIPIRIYIPQGSGPFPVLVYFHGGGWVLGNLDTHDGICRRLTNSAGCVVVSVDYRLAPEHKFPAAPEDCFAATEWVARHTAQFNGDPARVAIGGDSCGGTLTAVVTQMARDQGSPQLIFQVMLCPLMDFTANTPSMAENGEGYWLTMEDLRWFTNHYLRSEEDKKNPLASPGLSTNLSGLPPALIITAEYDLLRDEGEQYGLRLKKAGVPVTISRYHGMIHGFYDPTAPLDQGKRALNECAQALQAAFTPT